MKRILTTLALAAFMAAGAGTVFAEVFVDSAGFQSGKAERPPRAVIWSDAAGVAVEAGKKLLLRGKVVLKNRGPKPAEGVLVRYTVVPRLVSLSGGSGEGTWALPFLLDERRVPKVGANAVLEVPLTLSPKLDLYLAKLKRNGFRVDKLTLQAMVEPHADAAVKVVEAAVGLSQ